MTQFFNFVSKDLRVVSPLSLGRGLLGVFHLRTLSKKFELLQHTYFAGNNLLKNK